MSTDRGPEGLELHVVPVCMPPSQPTIAGTVGFFGVRLGTRTGRLRLPHPLGQFCPCGRFIHVYGSFVETPSHYPGAARRPEFCDKEFRLRKIGADCLIRQYGQSAKNSLSMVRSTLSSMYVRRGSRS